MAIRGFLNGGNWTLAGEFTEIETGKKNDRPELAEALALCKRKKAKLVIAKLDRLSRNLAFIAALMDSGVEFVAVDNPHANKLTLHILAAVAQHEREMIADRTRGALQAAKARGVQLGVNGRHLSQQFKAAAIVKATALAPVLNELKESGMSAAMIARELTARNIPTERGGKWHAQTVIRMFERLD